MIGTTLAGRYQIEEQIGIGGMGIVYRARDLRLRRDVAIKVIAPHLMQQEAARTRFLREAHALAGLMHPNIVTIFDMAEDPDTHTVFLVMELLSGHSLRHFIHDGNCPPPLECPTFSLVALLLCRALEAAHNKGVLHRDIKPENIFVCDDGILKLMDFGLARLLGDVSKNQSTTVAGTLAYMAPEQLRGDVMDFRTDLYALGVVFFEYITGALPFTGNNPGTVLLKHLTEAPPHLCDRLPDFPQSMDDIVTRMLAKEPDARFATAGEVRAALELVNANGKSLLGEVDQALALVRKSSADGPASSVRAYITQLSPVTATMEEIAAQLAPRPSSLRQDTIQPGTVEQNSVQSNASQEHSAAPSASHFASFLRPPARRAAVGGLLVLCAVAALYAAQSGWRPVNSRAITAALAHPLTQITPSPAEPISHMTLVPASSGQPNHAGDNNPVNNSTDSSVSNSADNASNKGSGSTGLSSGKSSGSSGLAGTPTDKKIESKSDKTKNIKKEVVPALTDKHLQELAALRKEQQEELALIKSLKRQIDSKIITPLVHSGSLVTAAPPGTALKPAVTAEKPVSTEAVPTASGTRNVMTMPVRPRFSRRTSPVIGSNNDSNNVTSQFEERRPQPALKVRAWHAVAPGDPKAIHIGLQNSADCNAYFYIIEFDKHRAVRAYPGPERFLVPQSLLPNDVRLPFASDTPLDNQKAVLVIASPREITSLPTTFVLPPPPQGSPPTGGTPQQKRAYIQQTLHHYDDQIGQQLERNNARIAGQPLHPHDIIIHIIGLNRL